VAERIARRRDEVFLTREFRDLGGEGQVLRGLAREGRLGASRGSLLLFGRRARASSKTMPEGCPAT
jgi:hypothetical protein